MAGGKLAAAGLAAVLAAAAALAAAGSPAPPTDGPSPAVEFGRAIGICRTAFLEQLAGGRPAQAEAQLEALSADQARNVILICAAYETGQRDLLEVLQSAGESRI